MRRSLLFFFALLIVSSGLMALNTTSVQAAPLANKCVNPQKTTILQGSIQGANYTIEVPSKWNGTLRLYSHGYVSPFSPLLNPAPVSGGDMTTGALLAQGDALAGSSYSQNGWALQQAFHDQIALLDFFNATCGHPKRTIAWGHSLGGIITAGLVQLYPNRFVGAMPMCGVLSGGIATWNQALDTIFAFNVLLANNTLPVVHITDPNGAFQQAEAILNAAQQTPQGRARLALVSALGDAPGWFDPASPEPAKNDFATQEQNQFLWASQVTFFFAFIARAELEARAGGNPSWNTGVNYDHQVQLSSDRREVQGLYKQAGLKLDQDLKTLNNTKRISADAPATAYLNRFITFNGNLDIPVLTVHTTGDGLVVNQNEQTYAHAVQNEDNSALLRQVFVHRAGHCTFTSAETLTAFHVLDLRLQHGRWDDTTDPHLLNQEAASLGPTFNGVPPAFISFDPTPFLRPFIA